MSIGELNKGAVVLIVALLVAASGFLWYSRLYKPATVERTSALAAQKTAVDGLTAAKAELATAQEQLEQAKSAIAKVDDSVARLAKSRAAIPDKRLVDDAAIVLMQMARRSGVDTSFSAGEGAGTDSTGEGGGPEGSTAVDLTFDATGSYTEMMQFISLVESTVDVKDGKMYSRGRLFNVVKLEIGVEDEQASGGNQSGAFLSDTGEDANKPAPRPGDIAFTVTVRMYTSSTENAAGVGAADAAANAAADPAAAGATGTATGTTTGADPNAPAGTGTGTSTDPGTAAPSTGTTGTPAPTPTGGQ